MNKSIFYKLLIGSLILSSCTEIFVPKIESDQSILVVDGKISNDKGPYVVKLFRTVPILSKDSILPEPNAIVRIHCDDGEIEMLQEKKEGIYQTENTDFRGEVNKTYWVEIETKDGSKYESIPETLQGSLNIDSIYGNRVDLKPDLDTKIEAVNFFFNLEDKSNQSKFYIWDYQESWEFRVIEKDAKTDDPAFVCYPTASSNKILTINASTLLNQNVDKLPIITVTERQAKFNHLYYLRINVNSISESCFLFWENIKKVSQNNGSIYDIIPTNARGNIESCDGGSPALGYFQVSSFTTNGKDFETSEFKLSMNKIPGECAIFPTMELDPLKHHLIYVAYIKNGDIVYYVRPAFCYDCSLKYSSDKPSFWF